MKVLILNNFLNNYNKILYYKNKGYFVKPYRAYQKLKLIRLIDKLSQKSKNKIKVISSQTEKLNINRNIEEELLNEFRLRLDRDVYSKIVKKVNKKTQANLKRIYNNLEDLKIFHINGIFIGKLIEFEFILYFNAFFGEFELLKKILQIEDYDKVILFNYNPNFSDFIGYLFSKFKNVEAYQDSLLKSINKRLNWHIFFHLYQIIKNNLIGYIVSKTQKISKKKVNQEKNDIVIFFGYHPKKLNFSPFQAIKPIYDYLKKKKMFSPIFYQQIKNYIPIREFCRILKALL